MLYLNNIQYHLPAKKIPVTEMESHTQLPPSTLKIFEKIYGLKNILVSDELSMFDLICASVDKIFLTSDIDIAQIKYLIHPHTCFPLIPFGSSLVQLIKEKFHLKQAISFGTSMQKCVSLLKMFDVLSTILDPERLESALIFTGEIGFTPSVRVIPKTSISGDASVAVLVSSSGNNHHLLAVETKFLPGFSKGFFLSDTELQCFDGLFITEMKYIILNAIKKAGLLLTDITLILPHNVNYPTWKKIAKALDLSIEKIYVDQISELGHCFASDGILNLAMAETHQQIKKGDYYLMAGCGMGFHFSCAVFQY